MNIKDYDYYTRLLSPLKHHISLKEQAIANLYDARALLINNQPEAAQNALRFAAQALKDINK